MFFRMFPVKDFQILKLSMKQKILSNFNAVLGFLFLFFESAYPHPHINTAKEEP